MFGERETNDEMAALRVLLQTDEDLSLRMCGCVRVTCDSYEAQDSGRRRLDFIVELSSECRSAASCADATAIAFASRVVRHWSGARDFMCFAKTCAMALSTAPCAAA